MPQAPAGRDDAVPRRDVGDMPVELGLVYTDLLHVSPHGTARP